MPPSCAKRQNCGLQLPGIKIYREELEVAVADDVKEVEAEQVRVEHGNAGAAAEPRAKQRDREVGRVHEMLHERVHRSGDGFRYEGSVMMRVVFLRVHFIISAGI